MVFAHASIGKSQTLYSISQRTSDAMDFLSKVNPMTGSTTLISTKALAKYMAQGVSTIDPINKRFFFISTGDTLYTVDLTTGNLLAKNKSSLSGTYTNYLFEFEKPCPSISTGIDNEYEPLIPSYKIFPNPFSSMTTLQTNVSLQDATVSIYNSLGQLVKQIQNASGQTITINRDNLTKGLYFIQLTRDNKKMLVEKLIITD